ncbi:MAG TPA: hypothetical protein VIJ35_25085, partial [Bradyrhizobium sp.]
MAEAGRPSRLCLVADNDLGEACLLSDMPIGLIRSDADVPERRICRETIRAIARPKSDDHWRAACRRPRKNGRWRTTARSNGIC